MAPTVLELISLRSFASIWYWLALAGLWSGVIHWRLGAPYDLVRRALRDEMALRDVERLVSITVRRRLELGGASGAIGAATLSGLMTALALLGFLYWLELAQAVFLLTAPLLLVWILDQQVARQMAARGPAADDLCRRLIRARWRTQFVGLVSIFFTAMWGAWWVLTTNPLAP